MRAIVTTREAGSDGRESSQHVLIGCADERALADGQVAWSWPPDAEVKFALVLMHQADDGGQQARRTEEIAKQP